LTTLISVHLPFFSAPFPPHLLYTSSISVPVRGASIYRFPPSGIVFWIDSRSPHYFSGPVSFQYPAIRLVTLLICFSPLSVPCGFSFSVFSVPSLIPLFFQARFPPTLFPPPLAPRSLQLYPGFRSGGPCLLPLGVLPARTSDAMCFSPRFLPFGTLPVLSFLLPCQPFLSWNPAEGLVGLALLFCVFSPWSRFS